VLLWRLWLPLAWPVARLSFLRLLAGIGPMKRYLEGRLQTAPDREGLIAELVRTRHERNRLIARLRCQHGQSDEQCEEQRQGCRTGRPRQRQRRMIGRRCRASCLLFFNWLALYTLTARLR